MQREIESISSLAGHIVKDSQKLLGQEKDLLKAELSEEWQKAKYSFFLLFMGSLMAITLSVLVSLALSQLLAVYTSIPLWGCYAIVAVLFGAVGLGYLWYFQKHFTALNFVPKETVANIKENFQCLITKHS